MSVRSPEFENLFTEFFEIFVLFVVCIKISNKTNNKRMQISVRSLELIFTETDWPATERQLEVSIDQKRENGKWKRIRSRYLGKQQCIAMTEY